MQLALGMALGCGLMYFFDPQQGNRRRKMAWDRGRAMLRRGWRAADSRRRKVVSDLQGKRQALMHSQATEDGQRMVEDVATRVPIRGSGG